MHESDVDTWCELLAGREVPGASEQLCRQANAMREALELRRESVENMEVTADQTEQGLRKLIAYGEATQAFEVPRAPVVAVGWMSKLWEKLRYRGDFGPAAAFASVLLVMAIVIGVSQQAEPPRVEIERGADNHGEPVQVSDPAGVAANLAAELRHLGVKPAVRQNGRFWFVDAVLPQPADERLSNLLRRYGLAEPVDGDLRAVFVGKP